MLYGGGSGIWLLLRCWVMVLYMIHILISDEELFYLDKCVLGALLLFNAVKDCGYMKLSDDQKVEIWLTIS